MFLMAKLAVLCVVICQTLHNTKCQFIRPAGTERNVSAEFDRFRTKFHVTHSSLEEYSQQRLNFQKALQRHVVLNRPATNNSARYGLNQFSHLSPQQFRALYLRAEDEVVERYNVSSSIKKGNGGGEELPERFDWRDLGKVGPVQDQGVCGSCWAFSIVGALESVRAQGHPHGDGEVGVALEELSVQQVLDCSYKDHGCDGGSTLRALSWLKETQVKLVHKVEYPYKGSSGICHFFTQRHPGVALHDFKAHDFSEEETIMKRWLVDYGPLVATVDAASWQDYLGGVIQHHCSSLHANHAVQIIGYDTTGSMPYWIVRNSWGSSWGLDGYAHIRIGSNLCGIADTVAAVFVSNTA